METALPTVHAVSEIESRQDEVLRKLDDLEKQILRTLAEFGDKTKTAGACPKLAVQETDSPPVVVAAACEGGCKVAGGGKCRRKAA